MCLIAIVSAAPPALLEDVENSDLEQGPADPEYVVAVIEPEDSDLETAASAQFGGFGRGFGYGGGYGGRYGGYGGGYGGYGGFGGGYGYGRRHHHHRHHYG